MTTGFQNQMDREVVQILMMGELAYQVVQMCIIIIFYSIMSEIGVYCYVLTYYFSLRLFIIECK